MPLNVKSCLKRSSTGRTAYHKACHGNIDPGLTGGSEHFIVFAEPTIMIKPSESAFNYPAARQDSKALLLVGAQDDLQTKTTMRHHPVAQGGAAIAAIKPDAPQFLTG